jgi:hypothetical protein
VSALDFASAMELRLATLAHRQFFNKVNSAGLKFHSGKLPGLFLGVL